MEIKNIKKLIGIVGLISVLGFCKQVKAIDPLLYGQTSNTQKEEGDIFEVKTIINPNNQKIDAIAGRINLSQLSCQNIELSDNNEILALEKPSCVNPEFVIGIKKGTLEETELFTLTVKANDSGFSSINFNDVDILGNGRLVSSAAIDSTFIVNSSSLDCECTNWKEWENQTCGEGSCSEEELLQTRIRTCNPSGCSVETASRCLEDSSCSTQVEIPEKEIIEKTTSTEDQFNREALMANLNRIWGEMTSKLNLTASLITIIVSVGLVFGVKKWKEVKRENKIQRFK